MKNSKTICIYNANELDSWCSAAIVKKRYPDAIMKGYKNVFPLKKVNREDTVIIVGVFMPDDKNLVDIVKKLSDECTLIFIDTNHGLPEKEFFTYTNSIPNYCESYLSDVMVACELTWNVFFPNVEKPEIVDLIGDYNLERNTFDEKRWNNIIKPFFRGLKCKSYKSFPSELLDVIPRTLTSPINRIVKKGVPDGVAFVQGKMPQRISLKK